MVATQNDETRARCGEILTTRIEKRKPDPDRGRQRRGAQQAGRSVDDDAGWDGSGARRKVVSGGRFAAVAVPTALTWWTQRTVGAAWPQIASAWGTRARAA